MSILEEIARERRKAVEEEKKLLSLLELERLLEEREESSHNAPGKGFPLQRHYCRGLSLFTDCKGL